MESSDPELIVRRRRYDATDYIFAVNDHRTFGSYVGQHGLVMEKGEPITARLTIRQPDAAVYALPRGGRVDSESTGNGLSFDVALDGGEGRLYMVTPRPIHAVQLETPRSGRPGEQIACHIAVVDQQGQPLPAVVPLHVRITDAQGNPAEFSGHYGAKDGRLELTLDLPTNAAEGDWKIHVKALASGKTAERTFEVDAPR